MEVVSRDGVAELDALVLEGIKEESLSAGLADWEGLADDRRDRGAVVRVGDMTGSIARPLTAVGQVKLSAA